MGDTVRLGAMKTEALDKKTRQKLELQGPVGVDQCVHVLGQLREKLAQPILIFDQFDDYQTRHRERFLRGEERRIVGRSTLIAENTFWKDVKGMLDDGLVRCVSCSWN